MERGSAPAKLTVPGAAVHGRRYNSAALCSATTARAQGKAVPGHTAHQPSSLTCSFSTLVASWARRAISACRSATGSGLVVLATITG